MGTRDEGLFHFQDGRIQQIKQGIPGKRVNCLLPVGREIWIGTDKGVVHWNGTGIDARSSVLLSGVDALAIISDRDSNLWVGTRNGLCG